MSLTRPDLLQLREQAIALRRAGKSRIEIKQALRVGSNQTLNDLLRGEPPPVRRHPKAKDDLRAKARLLREEGCSYKQIAAQLSVSMSSVSLWVRDLPRPDRLSEEECARRRDAAVAAYWSAERARRAAASNAIRSAAQAGIGSLSEREVLIAGAIAYWCEGAKSKAHRPSYRVSFINSDPELIRFFLTFLKAAGVRPEQLVFRLMIHERADAAAAQEYWQCLTGAGQDRFRRPTLKRHNPRTVRYNTGESYHGCLRVDVLASSGLYVRIEGWYAAIAASAGSP